MIGMTKIKMPAMPHFLTSLWVAWELKNSRASSGNQIKRKGIMTIGIVFARKVIPLAKGDRKIIPRRTIMEKTLGPKPSD